MNAILRAQIAAYTHAAQLTEDVLEAGVSAKNVRSLAQYLSQQARSIQSDLNYSIILGENEEPK